MPLNPSSSHLLVFRDKTPEAFQVLSSGERQELFDQWMAWYDGLMAAGKVRGGHPLQGGGRVVAASTSERVTDGPFVETKEAIGGYFLLAVDSLDEAIEIAKRCPTLRYGTTVEVRAIADCCHLGQPVAQAVAGGAKGAGNGA